MAFEIHFVFDIFTNEPGKKLADANNDIVYVHRLRIDDLFPAECEEAMREIGGAFRGGKDLIDIVVSGIIGCEFHFHEVSVTYDCSEDVVEVMSNASRQ